MNWPPKPEYEPRTLQEIVDAYDYVSNSGLLERLHDAGYRIVRPRPDCDEYHCTCFDTERTR